MFWIVATFMTLAALSCVLWPLRPRVRWEAPLGANDLHFYREQMQAIDRDLASGLVAPSEASGSRAEIGRRLIAASERGAMPRPTPQRSNRPIAAAAFAAILVPCLTLGLYSRVGAPLAGDQPLAARLDVQAPDTLATAIERVERHLTSHPDDGRGFDLLAPLYFRLGRYDDAKQAYERAIALLGDNSARSSGYAQALAHHSESAPAASTWAAWNQAVIEDPSGPQAQFLLGEAAVQKGDATRARELWTRLIAESPPDAAWLPLVRTRLAALDGAPVPLGTDLGPKASPAAAAIAALPAEQRQAAIRGMVDRLATRLKADGQDTEGWLRLVRAYSVLGEQGKALDALAEARKTLASDAPGVSQLNALAQELGLGL